MAPLAPAPPRSNQATAVGSQPAMLDVVLSPAVAQQPPAISFEPCATSAVTCVVQPPPCTPRPRACQVPSHMAMLFAGEAKLPPAYTSGCAGVPMMARAETGPSVPLPSAAHPVPFHRATWLTTTAPAVVKSPPM